MITDGWGRVNRVFFIKLLVVDKSEFCTSDRKLALAKGKKLLLHLICFKCLGK